jgi:Fic family protein
MKEFTQAIDTISRRAEEVTHTPEASLHVQEELQKLINYWTQRASRYASLGYEEARTDKTVKLLKKPGRGKWEPFTALNSLRDVEPGIQLLLDESSLGEPSNGDTSNDNL